MGMRDALLHELDLEVPFFRSSLERVPLDRGSWKPHDKSMPLGWLATFLCVMWSWGTIAIEQESFDPARRAGAGQRPETPGSTADLMRLFDETVGAYRLTLAGTTDEHLMKKWTLFNDGVLFFEQPRWIVLRTFILNHAVHHRGQLGVYLRMLGVAVPAIYNDSGDEKGGMFR